MNTLPQRKGTQWEGALTQPVDRWLASFGFRFNPFVNLEASSDPYLYRYMVQLDAFDTLYHEQPSLVFESRGGGKTALHIHILQTCYIGQENNRPFPISYFPPFLQWEHTQPTFADHLQAILTSGAKQLLITLLYRPHWFARLDRSDRQLIVAFLNRDLPGPLLNYLKLLNAPGALNLVQRSLRLSPGIKLTPNHANLDDLSGSLSELRQDKDQSPVAARWEKFVHIILNVLQLRSIYLLIDGLDTVQETAEDNPTLVHSCAQLWERINEWANQRILVKAFLPVEAQTVLYEQFHTSLKGVSIANIQWSTGLLQQMLTERTIAATNGEMGGLYTLANPDLNQLEEQIIATVPKLPREVLALTQAVFNAHLWQSGPVGKLNQGDFRHGLIRYQETAPHLSI